MEGTPESLSIVLKAPEGLQSVFATCWAETLRRRVKPFSFLKTFLDRGFTQQGGIVSLLPTCKTNVTSGLTLNKFLRSSILLLRFACRKATYCVKLWETALSDSWVWTQYIRSPLSFVRARTYDGPGGERGSEEAQAHARAHYVEREEQASKLCGQLGAIVVQKFFAFQSSNVSGDTLYSAYSRDPLTSSWGLIDIDSGANNTA